MGALLTIPAGLNIEAVADGYEAAVATGLVYANFFNTTANLQRNLADGGDPGTSFGTPVVDAEFAEVGEDDYIDTGIPSPTGDFTWIVVANTTDNDQTSWLINSRNAAADTGHWLYRAQFAPDRLTAGGYFDVSGVPTADTLTSPIGILTEGVPFCVALRYNATSGLRKIDALTAGEATSDTVADPPEASSDTILIGRTVDDISSGGSGIAAVFLYDRSLSDSELAVQYAQIKAAMAVVGVTV
ncbi:CAP domain-containing protein [Chachezhania sediminis]|uniref:hypothetical protein n=1 Tax=Chachezhania sediminis TaxID=2599291 RepID=UPI00131B4592|nr:hypothetical protein [Chachezhania sediminis]